MPVEWPDTEPEDENTRWARDEKIIGWLIITLIGVLIIGGLVMGK